MNLSPFDMPGPTRRKVTCMQVRPGGAGQPGSESERLRLLPALRSGAYFSGAQRDCLAGDELVALYARP